MWKSIRLYFEVGEGARVLRRFLNERNIVNVLVVESEDATGADKGWIEIVYKEPEVKDE